MGRLDDHDYADEVSERIDAPAERVYDLVTDLPRMGEWSPENTGGKWLDGATGGLGHEREVALRALGRFRERFIAWEPPHRFAFTIIATTSPMIHQLGEDYRLEPEGAGTQLRWTMGSSPRGVGKLATPLLRPLLRSILGRAARNLDRQLTAP